MTTDVRSYMCKKYVRSSFTLMTFYVMEIT